MGVGMPAQLMLDQWAAQIYDVFGEVPYHVGSSLKQKTGWRDVDVRVILEDDEWERWFGKFQKPPHLNRRWAIMMTAFALWGREYTGLPIDFQVVPRQYVTEEEWNQPRSALGIYLRINKA